MAQKKQTKKKSCTTEAKQLSSATPASAEQINIEHLLAKAIQRHSNEPLPDWKDKQKELGHLASIIEEYLSSYILIGYTLQDEQVVFFDAPTPKDEAALVDLLRSTFFDIVNGRQ
jgi:hypothetical protein